MKTIVTAKNLYDAADFIEYEDRWTRGEYVAGVVDFLDDTEAVQAEKCKDAKFCALGVLAHVKGYRGEHYSSNPINVAAAEALIEAFEGKGWYDDPTFDAAEVIIEFNDEPNRQAKTVANRFRKAAELLTA